MRIDGTLVVLRMRAVGGAYFHETRTGAGHHVRHAEGSADLHQFATRHQHLAALRQRGDHEQHRCGIVVDHSGGLRTGEAAEQRFDQTVAVATRTSLQVVLEVVGTTAQRNDALERKRWQRCPSKVGVDHRAGEVDHRTRRRGKLRLATRGEHRCQLIEFGFAGAQFAAIRTASEFFENDARSIPCEPVSVLERKGRRSGVTQEAINRGDAPEVGRNTVDHGCSGPRAHGSSGRARCSMRLLP